MAARTILSGVPAGLQLACLQPDPAGSGQMLFAYLPVTLGAPGTAAPSALTFAGAPLLFNGVPLLLGA